MSQKEEILDYLTKYSTINSFECYIKLQIVDLQHSIYELRKEGYKITDKWIQKKNKKGRTIQFKEYRLEVE